MQFKSNSSIRKVRNTTTLFYELKYNPYIKGTSLHVASSYSGNFTEIKFRGLLRCSYRNALVIAHAQIVKVRNLL